MGPALDSGDISLGEHPCQRIGEDVAADPAGFNLYYGALKNTPYRWLDLEALCRRLLPRDEIAAIRYCTALVVARPSDPGQPQRQQTYLRALRTLPSVSVHLGSFRSDKVRMPVANPLQGQPATVEVIKTEEKRSDVNVASHLLLDAFQGNCDTAVVISNDSDFRVPIRIAEEKLGTRIGIVNPHKPAKRSRDLTATFFKQLRPATLAKCQLPAVLRDSTGEFRKPASW